MKVVWFSCGVSSFMAAYLTKDADKIIYIHNDSQHEDSLRFLKDAEKILNREIEILSCEKYPTHFDVIEGERFINSPYGAPCTKYLKRLVRKEWESKNPGWHQYVWGYDSNELKRAERLQDSMSDYEHYFPLIENNLTKEDCHKIANNLGLRRPYLYDLGYPNNNCVGCVKGGMGYWNKIRIDFPEVFRRMAVLEREIGRTVIKGVYLDELEPNRGRNKEIELPSCDVICEMLTKAAIEKRG